MTRAVLILLMLFSAVGVVLYGTTLMTKLDAGKARGERIINEQAQIKVEVKEVRDKLDAWEREDAKRKAEGQP